MAELTDRIRGKDYDLLITDLRMPEANGYEILELLRMSDIGNSRELPVVAATAAGYVSEEELKEAGFSGLLPKPFSIDELMEATRHCIREKRNRQPDFSALLAFGRQAEDLGTADGRNGERHGRSPEGIRKERHARLERMDTPPQKLMDGNTDGTYLAEVT